MSHYDIAIIGGGIAGRVLAAALKRFTITLYYSVELIRQCRNEFTNRLKVALVDLPAGKLGAASLGINPLKSNPLNTKHSTKRRGVSSINSKNYNFLTTLCSLTGHPFNNIKVWDRDSKSPLDFTQEQPIGWIIDNQHITNQMQEYTNGWLTEIKGNVKILNTDHYKVSLNVDEALMTCDLLVGADGRDSIVKKLIKPSTIERDYNQKAIVATVNTSQFDGTTAFQRFLPGGPFALLPLSKDTMSMVWTLSSKVADSLLNANLSEDLWTLMLRAAIELHSFDAKYYSQNPTQLTMSDFTWRRSCLEDEEKQILNNLPIITKVDLSSIAAFPLSMSFSKKTVANRSVIIGDAAHVVHPLAGQGANLGIGDAYKLTESIASLAKLGLDVGEIDYYRRFEKQRLATAATITGFIELIHRVYQSDDVRFRYLCDYGMQLFDKIPFAKRLAMLVAQT